MKSTKRFIGLITALITLPSLIYAQGAMKMANEDREDKNTVYRVQYSGDVFIHSRGFGAGFQYGRLLDAKNYAFWRVEILGLKSPKETRVELPLRPETRGFVYGKINTLTSIRTMYGRELKLFTKSEKKGVTISLMYSGGINLGIQKPVYAIIEKRIAAQDEIITSLERYDPDIHRTEQIRGRGPLFKGLNQATIIPGITLKSGVNFEYSSGYNKVRALETGIVLDTFFRQTDIMSDPAKKSVFLTAYLSYQFGRKLY